jgi:Zn-dependent alcohol dehydrogenase
MKAAVYHGANRPLELTEVPDPIAKRDEVVVRVAGCGLCHTDLHYLDHGVKTFKSPPLILGHEAAGTVAALGEGVDGAYAELVAVPASELIAVPDELPLERACVVADAISTPYHAVKHRGRVRAGDTVGVVGCGGVGLNVVQCAAVAGAHVIAVDINRARLDVAQRLGAVETVNPQQVDRVDKHVRALTDGGVDIAFEAIGTPETIRMAYGLLRRGGRLCVIGYSHKDATLSAARLMYYELEIVGSLGCGGGEYPEIIGLVRDGRLKLDPIVSGSLPLNDINEGFERLRKGEGIRWVVTP